MTSIDAEKELIKMMADEMMGQINREIISDLLNMTDPYRVLSNRKDFEFDEQDNNK